jgi:dolichyl-diphosphooligosaccharide--protein glycosyltransferase
MSPSEAGTGEPTAKARPGFVRAFRSNYNQSWLGRNWQTVAVLALLIFLAFFLRSYFVYGPSVDNGYIVSGGSDSYYHQRVIDYVASTGHHLIADPMLNYPVSYRDARPPLYDWSVAVTGMAWSSITGSSVADDRPLAGLHRGLGALTSSRCDRAVGVRQEGGLAADSCSR